MQGLKLLFVTTDSQLMNRVKEKAVSHFESKGYTIVWKASYPNVEYSDVEAAMRDNDLDRKNAEWVRSMNVETIEPVLEAAEGQRPTVRAWGLQTESNNTMEWYGLADDILEEVGAGQAVQYQLSSVSPHETPVGTSHGHTKNKHAPFSYDPSQDFKTEPDRTP